VIRIRLCLPHTSQFVVENSTAVEQHCKAVAIMVRMKGGLYALQGFNFLGSLVKWSATNPDLLREDYPEKMAWKELEALIGDL
jgi:hypothetical protein